MIEVLDKELNIRALIMEEDPNLYYISFTGMTKTILKTKETTNNNIMLSCFPQEHCTAEELNIIIDRFSKYIYTKNPNIKGILFKSDPNELLSSIGFNLLNHNSDYLYQENLNLNKEREGTK